MLNTFEPSDRIALPFDAYHSRRARHHYGFGFFAFRAVVFAERSKEIIDRFQKRQEARQRALSCV